MTDSTYIYVICEKYSSDAQPVLAFLQEAVALEVLAAMRAPTYSAQLEIVKVKLWECPRHD